MDDEYPLPLLVVGDLVRCVYDLYHYYYPVPQSYSMAGDGESAKYGVIAEVDYARFGDIFGYEVLYLVLCTDGVTRYFTEYEVQKIS